MKVGVVFPQIEIGADPGGVREYVQTAEELGYHHIIVYDHVLGADTRHYKGWDGFYSYEDMFHEAFVVFGYMAGITSRIELVTSVIILGQRQTALVAKQAAEVDILTGGRFRLGVGTGWNAVEYEALGEDFHNRGRRSEEQIELMRALWTQESVEFNGRWHRITHAGLNPLPVQRPIPVWLGGSAEPVLRRVGQMADGWFPQFQPGDPGQAGLARMKEYAREAGRDPASIGVEGRLVIANGNEEYWVKQSRAWEALDVTHMSVDTMRGGLKGPKQHIDALRLVKDVVGF